MRGFATDRRVDFCNAVKFGNTPAEGFTVVSPTLITAIASAGASGQVNVVVTTANGASVPTSKAHYKYENPVMKEVQPSHGPLSGGNAVTILGSGFAPGSGLTTFTFGKAIAGSVVCVSTRMCTLIAPAGKRAGAVDVVAAVGKAKSKKSEPEESGDGEGEHFEYTYQQTGS